ncbi:ATP-binding protein [Candidatus Chloroploca asiatica]|uniref:Anti-sigma regulatory factor n=1 Tax=Candidatus Chloroploca asiatica TaxID=1506545 RepID=A0A2H3KIS3_9CHLR|nr:ATP-binding protein [Candidatus Chloroploca asiatica]PDV97751.1 anti-sigma regulatory factor [Candidatus Chloroploca asiatica]
MHVLTVPADLDSLDAVGKYVVEAASQAGLDRKAAYRLRLAVDEIMTNIINYGHTEVGLTGDVIVRAAIEADTLTIILEDRARPFDPRERPEPEDLDRPLEERNIGGLGVYLALKGVDHFNYEYVDQMNRNIFVMYRPLQA